MLSKERRRKREQDEDLSAWEFGFVVPVSLRRCFCQWRKVRIREQHVPKCCSGKTKELSYIAVDN